MAPRRKPQWVVIYQSGPDDGMQWDVVESGSASQAVKEVHERYHEEVVTQEIMYFCVLLTDLAIINAVPPTGVRFVPQIKAEALRL